MSCVCGRPVNGMGRRCCLACRHAPDGGAHSRYCAGGRYGGHLPRGVRRPVDYGKFDRLVIDWVTAGTAVRVGQADTGEAVRRLVLQGKNDTEIGELIGRSARQVLRIRRRLGLPAVPRWRSGHIRSGTRVDGPIR